MRTQLTDPLGKLVTDRRRPARAALVGPRNRLRSSDEASRPPPRRLGEDVGGEPPGWSCSIEFPVESHEGDLVPLKLASEPRKVVERVRQAVEGGHDDAVCPALATDCERGLEPRTPERPPRPDVLLDADELPAATTAYVRQLPTLLNEGRTAGTPLSRPNANVSDEPSHAWDYTLIMFSV